MLISLRPSDGIGVTCQSGVIWGHWSEIEQALFPRTRRRGVIWGHWSEIEQALFPQTQQREALLQGASRGNK